MRRHWPALACLFISSPFTGSTLVAFETPDSPYVQAVQNLSHPKFAEREAADKKLRQIGADALPALKDQLEKRDLEAQARARRIIAAIDEQSIGARLLAAPRIRLQFDNITVVDAIKTVNTQTGFQFTLNDPTRAIDKRRITLDTGEVPLWEALEQFFKASGLTEAIIPAIPPQNAYGYSSTRVVRYGVSQTTPAAGRTIGLVDGTREGVADLKSAVKVQTLPKSHAVNRRTAGSNELTLGVEVSAPASFGLRAILGIDITDAVDEGSQKLTQKLTPTLDHPSVAGFYGELGGQVFFGGGGFGGGVFQIDGDISGSLPSNLNCNQTSFTLNLGKSPSKRLPILEGIVHAAALMPDEAIHTFDDLQKDGELSHKAGSFDFRIKEVKEVKKGHWTIRCTYESATSLNLGMRPWANDVDASGNGVGTYDFSMSNGLPKFTCLDQDGKPIKKNSSNIVSQSYRTNNLSTVLTSDILLTVLTEGDQLPKQMILSGRRIAALRIPFQLKEVPLP